MPWGFWSSGPPRRRESRVESPESRAGSQERRAWLSTLDSQLGPEDQTAGLEVLGENMENSRRKVLVRKVRQGYHAYREMLHYYAVKNLLDYLTANPAATLESMAEQLAGPRERDWVNLGGQLAPAPDVEKLLADIKAGKHQSWADIHQAYDALWAIYPLQKQRHAFATLLELLGIEVLTPEAWNSALDEAVRIQEHIRDQVFLTREKDYRNRFRQTTFRNADEMRAVIGTAEDNSFVKLVRRQTEEFKQLVQAVRGRPTAARRSTVLHGA